VKRSTEELSRKLSAALGEVGAVSHSIVDAAGRARMVSDQAQPPPLSRAGI